MAKLLKLIIWPFETEHRGIFFLTIFAITVTSTAIWLSVRDTAIQNEQIIEAHEKTRQEIAKMMERQDEKRDEAIERIMRRIDALQGQH